MDIESLKIMMTPNFKMTWEKDYSNTTYSIKKR